MKLAGAHGTSFLRIGRRPGWRARRPGVAPAIVHAQANIRWRLTSSFPKVLDTLFGVNDVFAQKVKELTAASSRSPPTRRVNWCRPSAPSTRCRTARSRWPTPRRTTTSARTRPLRCLRHSVRPEQPPDDGLDFEGNGLKLMREFYRRLQHHQLPDGQHRRPDGRLVPQADQVAGRVQGHQVPRRRLRRQGGRAHRRRAAEHPRRRDLPGAGKGHDRRRRVGRARTTTRSWASTRWPRTTPTRAGGKAARSWTCTSTPRPTTPVPEYKAVIECASAYATPTCRPSTTQERRVAEAAGGQGAKLFPFPKDLMDAAFKEAMALYSEISAKNPAWKKVYDDYAPSARRQPVVPLHRSHVRRLHAAPEAVTARRPEGRCHRTKKPRMRGPFFMVLRAEDWPRRTSAAAGGARIRRSGLLAAAASCLTASCRAFIGSSAPASGLGISRIRRRLAGRACGLGTQRRHRRRVPGGRTPMVSSALSASTFTPCRCRRSPACWASR
jgi:hypothetical protein